MLQIQVGKSVNGLAFGVSVQAVYDQLGEPDQIARNYTGEIEMAYSDRIYRCLNNRLVEITFPDKGRIAVDSVEILSVFPWLGGLENTVDIAGFRISLAHGIAYDCRDPEQGSITVFEAGHWDDLVAGAQSPL